MALSPVTPGCKGTRQAGRDAFRGGLRPRCVSHPVSRRAQPHKRALRHVSGYFTQWERSRQEEERRNLSLRQRQDKNPIRFARPPPRGRSGAAPAREAAAPRPSGTAGSPGAGRAQQPPPLPRPPSPPPTASAPPHAPRRPTRCRPAAGHGPAAVPAYPPGSRGAARHLSPAAGRRPRASPLGGRRPAGR